jgi:hypothetical protein
MPAGYFIPYFAKPSDMVNKADQSKSVYLLEKLKKQERERYTPEQDDVDFFKWGAPG